MLTFVSLLINYPFSLHVSRTCVWLRRNYVCWFLTGALRSQCSRICRHCNCPPGERNAQCESVVLNRHRSCSEVHAVGRRRSKRIVIFIGPFVGHDYIGGG